MEREGRESGWRESGWRERGKRRMGRRGDGEGGEGKRMEGKRKKENGEVEEEEREEERNMERKEEREVEREEAYLQYSSNKNLSIKSCATFSNILHSFSHRTVHPPKPPTPPSTPPTNLLRACGSSGTHAARVASSSSLFRTEGTLIRTPPSVKPAPLSFLGS